VRYARDAFEGLRLMDAIALAKTDPEVSLSEALPELRQRRVRQVAQPEDGATTRDTTRSDVATDNAIPTPPFWGTRVVKGIALADYTAYLDERATFLGQWGLKPSRGSDGPSYEELVETEGHPRLRMWLDRIKTEDLLEAAVVYGYFPCFSEGNDVVVLGHTRDGDGQVVFGEEVCRFTFPRQRRDRRLCLADFFRSRERYEADGIPDVIPLQLVTMGSRVAQATGALFDDNAYRDYLELHGLSVQLTEALAEMWHARVRDELGFGAEDAPRLDEILRQRHRGSRYSFGYPACPDLEDRAKLVALLRPERIGVSLSEELQLHPEQSTDALVVHHPEAKYFNAG
jgi:5-methyltetrahydrofolate--homocysteine methyltransferase